MRVRRVFGLDPECKPLPVLLCTAQIEGRWAAMIVAEGEQPPASGQLKGLAFFGMTPEEAERQALAYLEAGSVN